ncbi:MAG: mitochondrial ribosomal small subunit component [Chrysothrix sp. TS-e1954]|nr:MAG: mitochondrial ribosomal small subunit component [Chrysothrix sp. TS-e1954]
MTRAKNLRPSRVLAASRAQTSAMQGSLKRPLPSWYGAMTLSPPSQNLVREMPVQHRETNASSALVGATQAETFKRPKRFRKPSRQFQPQQMSYEEDKLRTEFFGDHPWELARPRMILEDGLGGEKANDGKGWDWSQAHQHGRPVNGESVIQRQHWLMTHASRDAADAQGKKVIDPSTGQAQRIAMDSSEAYDTARLEHYAVRHHDAVESRVAAEEALATGANFGPTALDVGMELENRTYERWKGWAKGQVTIIEQARSAAYTGNVSGSGSGSDTGQAENSEEKDPNSLSAVVDQMGINQAPRPVS